MSDYIETTTYVDEFEELVNNKSLNISFVINYNISETINNSSSITRIDMTKVRIIVLSVQLINILLPNTILFLILLKSLLSKPQSRTFWFMFHLCIADLLVAIFTVLTQLLWFITKNFYGPNWLCKFVKWFQLMPLYLSSLLVMFMAMDRYIAVSWKISAQIVSSKKIVKFMVVMAWIISSLLALPQIYFFKMQPNHKLKDDCWVYFNPPWMKKAYILYYAAFAFFIPLIVLTVTFWMLFLKLKNYNRDPKPPKTHNKSVSFRLEELKNPSNGTSAVTLETTVSKQCSDMHVRCYTEVPSHESSEKFSQTLALAKIKTIHLSMTITIAFIVCHLPFILSKLYYVIYSNGCK